MSSKLKMKKRRSTCRKLSTLNFQLSTLVAIALFFAMPLKAQVTIGPKDTSSDKFYLMKINSTADKPGGLRMTQLSADQIDGANGLSNQLLNLAPEDAAAAKGLVVFNTDTKCLQVWNGTDWISLCSDVIPTLETNPTSLQFQGTLQFPVPPSQTVTVTGSLSGWTVSSDQTWCTVSPSSGTDGQAFTVSVTEYFAGAQQQFRFANITVSAGSMKKTIFVTQGSSMTPAVP